MPSTWPSEAACQALVEGLLTWYDQEARDLPWRRTRDPYAIWVSEILLQQTRVETVLQYYPRFLEAFPTVEALARAPLDRVLKVWEGLGYYARARNLHRAAQVVMNQYAGRLPRDPEQLASLPGIGRSTAGAIASIAFHQPVPVLDGNVRRVLCRWTGWGGDPLRSPLRERLWRLAADLVPPDRPGDYNQALMELGARVCIPREPQCRVCPIQATCQGYQQGMAARLPTPRSPRPLPHQEVVVGLIWKQDRLLIAQRPPKGLLGGLWEFPGGKREPGETLEGTLVREIQEELGVRVRPEDRFCTVRHAYTHFRITLHAFHCRLIQGTPKTTRPWRWVHPGELDQYAFPEANRKIIRALRVGGRPGTSGTLIEEEQA